MRHHRRLLTIILVAVAFSLLAAPAEAGRKWCHKDPVIRVGGTNVKIDVAVYDDQKQYVNGPVVVKFYVPPGTNAELVMVDDGFNGYGEVVTIYTDKRLKATSRSIQFRIMVEIPSTIRMSAQITITPGSSKSVSASGRTNAVLSASGSVVPAK